MKEPIITTISDDEISVDETIFQLLDGFRETQQTISIEFADPDFPENIKNIDQARILTVVWSPPISTIDIQGYFAKSSAKYKRIPFHHIRKISLIASKQTMAKKYRVNRWHLLDVAEIIV